MWDVRVPGGLGNWKDREESKGKGGEEAQGRVFASLSSTPPPPVPLEKLKSSQVFASLSEVGWRGKIQSQGHPQVKDERMSLQWWAASWDRVTRSNSPLEEGTGNGRLRCWGCLRIIWTHSLTSALSLSHPPVP